MPVKAVGGEALPLLQDLTGYAASKPLRMTQAPRERACVKKIIARTPVHLHNAYLIRESVLIERGGGASGPGPGQLDPSIGGSA